MTMPMPDDAREPVGAPPSADERDRALRKIARKWTYLVRMTNYVPLAPDEVERELLELVRQVYDAVTGEPFTADRASAAGARLVDLHCTGNTSLRCSVDVLAGALMSDPGLRHVEQLGQRVVAVLGALASGYAWAIRESTMDQQDSIYRALHESVRLYDRERLAAMARLDEVLACVDSGVAIVDLDGRFLRTNAALDRMLGRTSAEVTELTVFDVFRQQDGLVLRDMVLSRVERIRLRQKLVGKDGDTLPVSLTASLVHGPDDEHYVVVIPDDTELNLLQNQLNHQLLHDALTGLPNRQYFTTRLEHVLNTASPTTVYRLHLDTLPFISDGFGHDVADRLLLAVAQRLTAAFADDEAMIARIEGTGFAILVECSPASPGLPAVVEKINEVVSEPLYLGEQGVSTSVSTGVVHRPAHRIEPAELLRAADMAVRHARSAGPGRWKLFDQERDERDRQAFRLAATMPSAWETGEIRVVYRPLVRLTDEQVIGVDALLRWDLLPHDQCMALVEQAGLAIPVGTWLLRQTCAQLGSRRDLLLAVAITATQAADPELPDTVFRALHETAVGPARLQLAMPASPLFATEGRAAANLKALADAGIQTTVYSPDFLPADPAFLAELPVRAVRTSQGRGTTRHPLMARIATDLVTVLHTAGAAVIVDNIETRQQATWWHHTGADAATGPLFDPDGPHDTVDTLLPTRC
jgi:diguanylate cyclase (GGDEF)-like protein/PAS domain S-box-containing protein